MTRAYRGAIRPAAVVAALALWVLSLGGPALAHAGLEEASPEYDEAVPRPPGQVRLTFNEPVEAEFDPVEVYAPGGERADAGDARTDPDDPTVVVASLEGGLPAGEYRVEWRATSADGHPIDGDYRFVAREGAAGEADGDRGGAPDGAAGPAAGEEPPGSPLAGGAGRIAAYGVLGVGVAAAVAVVLMRQRNAR